MSDATDIAVTKLTDALEAGIKSIGTMGEKYGHDVIDAGLSVVRIQGVQAIMLGLFYMALAAGCFWGGRRLWAWALALRAKVKDSDWDNEEAHIPSILLFVASSVLACAGMTTIFNPWTWIAIIEPKLWIAHRLLGL